MKMVWGYVLHWAVLCYFGLGEMISKLVELWRSLKRGIDGLTVLVAKVYRQAKVRCRIPGPDVLCANFGVLDN
jgi:hypothetical protein